MARKQATSSQNFLNILGSTGKWHLTVPLGTEGSVVRDYETSDGKKGSKNELLFDAVGGKIIDMEIREGDYGTNIILAVMHEDGVDHLSFATASPFGEDLMKKFPNIDLKEEVEFSPFNFIDEKGKNRRGLSVKQGENKIENYFTKEVKSKKGEGTIKEADHGLEKIALPKPKGKAGKISKEQWKMYFASIREFLLDYTQEHVVDPFKATKKEEDDKF